MKKRKAKRNLVHNDDIHSLKHAAMSTVYSSGDCMHKGVDVTIPFKWMYSVHECKNHHFKFTSIFLNSPTVHFFVHKVVTIKKAVVTSWFFFSAKYFTFHILNKKIMCEINKLFKFSLTHFAQTHYSRRGWNTSRGVKWIK